jgi:hypothetical protein
MLIFLKTVSMLGNKDADLREHKVWSTSEDHLPRFLPPRLRTFVSPLSLPRIKMHILRLHHCQWRLDTLRCSHNKYFKSILLEYCPRDRLIAFIMPYGLVRVLES